MAFPTTSVLEYFEGTLAGWVNVPNPLGNAPLAIDVASHTAMSSVSPGFSSGIWNATYGPDCECFYTVSTKGNTSEEIAVVVRITGTGATHSCYALMWEASGAWRLIKVTGGNQDGAAIDSGSQVLANGDMIGISAVGSTITGYRNPAAGGGWAAVGSGTDATYGTAGYIGLDIYDTTYRLDDFGGGTIGDSPPPPGGGSGGGQRMRMGVG